MRVMARDIRSSFLMNGIVERYLHGLECGSQSNTPSDSFRPGNHRKVMDIEQVFPKSANHLEKARPG